MQRYIHIILDRRMTKSFRLQPLPPTPYSSFFSLTFFICFYPLLLSASFVVSWPISCQLYQLASVPDNFFFWRKFRDISYLQSLLFLAFLYFPLPDLSFKLWLFWGYKKNNLPKMMSDISIDNTAVINLNLRFENS